MGRKPNPERERIDLRAERELIDRIERARAVWGESISQYVRRAVVERLQREEANLPPLKPKGKP